MLGIDPPSIQLPAAWAGVRRRAISSRPISPRQRQKISELGGDQPVKSVASPRKATGDQRSPLMTPPWGLLFLGPWGSPSAESHTGAIASRHQGRLPSGHAQQSPTTAIATLGQLHNAEPRRYRTRCDACRHMRALPWAPFVIRWGPAASSDTLRQRLGCRPCGHRGASLQHPSWVDMQNRWQPFPGEAPRALMTASSLW